MDETEEAWNNHLEICGSCRKRGKWNKRGGTTEVYHAFTSGFIKGEENQINQRRINNDQQTTTEGKMIDKDKQIVEQWWINLYDSIEPAKERISDKEFTRECWRAYSKAYRQSEKGNAVRKAYYQKNRDKILAQVRAYQKKKDNAEVK